MKNHFLENSVSIRILLNYFSCESSMSLLIACTCIVLFYGCLWFFDSFFKSCMHYPYYAFMRGTGLQIGFLKLTWTTTAFNKCIYRWSKRLSWFLNIWYNVGYFVTIYLFLPFSIWTLLSTILEHMTVQSAVDHLPKLQAIIPGVNIPLSDFWVYFIPIAMASVFHELGHALAAARENVGILSFGMIIFFVIPMAFVEINSDINSLPARKSLKIYCAGVWHNIALGIFALVIILTMPYIFSLFFSLGHGVRIVYIKDPMLKGEDNRGFMLDDVITDINGCKVRDHEDWAMCLHMSQEHNGLCISHKYLDQFENNAGEDFQAEKNAENCCEDDENKLCFKYVQPSIGAKIMIGNFICLSPRDIFKHLDYLPCEPSTKNTCPSKHECLKPSLQNGTYLFVLSRQNYFKIIYIGVAYEIYNRIAVDPYIPKFNFLRYASPQVVNHFIGYVFMFSMGIAFLNVIPCYATDGHHIARNIFQVLARKLGKGTDFVTFFTAFSVVLGTALTVPTLIFMFIKTIYEHKYDL